MSKPKPRRIFKAIAQRAVKADVGFPNEADCDCYGHRQKYPCCQYGQGTDERFDAARFQSARELQCPLDRLEARLVSQWVQEGIGLQEGQSCVAHAHGLFN